MSVNKKLRASFIAFVLLFSTLSFIVIPGNVIADGPGEDFSELFELLGAFFGDLFSPHPYRFVASYFYNGTETVAIDGDLEFDLYFSSTLLTKLEGLDYRDQVNISVHSYNADGFSTEQLDNANITLTLEPKLFEETIQNCNVTLKDINHTLHMGDYLLFSIEILQSNKPISKLVENRYKNHIRPNLVKLANRLNESGKNKSIQLSENITSILDIIDEFGITSEDIADIFNSLRSSAFVYDSTTYPSKVKIPLDNDDNLTLYFHNIPDFENDPFELGTIKILNEIEATGDNESRWPPLLINVDVILSGMDMEQMEWMNWFMVWVFYVILKGGEAYDENKITYYLTSDKKLDASGAEEEKTKIKLSGNNTLFEGPAQARNKILKSAKADLYVYFPKALTLSTVRVKATLLDGDNPIDTDEKEINRAGILEALLGPNEPTTFTFDIPSDYEEILNGNKLNLKVEVTQAPKFSILKTTTLVTGINFPSSLYVEFKETTNINMTLADSETEKYVVPGDSTEFTLNITSKHDDTITLEVIEELLSDDFEFEDTWNVEYPEKVEVKKDSYNLVKILVTSTDESESAEDDRIDLTFIATGKTGIDSKEATVKVDEKAVEYNINVTVKPTKQEVKHGENCTYQFTIKNMNTGIWVDNYRLNVTSENDWELDINYDEDGLDNVDIGEEVIVNVTIYIPKYTSISSDSLIFNVTSTNSIKMNRDFSTTISVTTSVITPNIFEQFYHFFESLAEDLGLDEVLGDFAAPFLIILMVFLIILILVLLVIIIRKKYVEIVCLDRIKDVSPDEEVKFELTIRNPTKRDLTYEIITESEIPCEGLDVTLDNDNIYVESKQSKVVVLTISSNDYVKPDDWIEVKVVVKVAGRNKPATISTVSTIKEAKTDLRIYGVFHWPRIFKKGDRVETSFKIENKGNVSVNNVTVVLMVNGKEKNKVEGITIPRGGYAEIEIPWIAAKGKNDVDIVVK